MSSTTKSPAAPPTGPGEDLEQVPPGGEPVDPTGVSLSTYLELGVPFAGANGACESCGLPAEVWWELTEDPFLLCVRCVPVEAREEVLVLPGHEDAVEVALTTLIQHEAATRELQAASSR